MIRQTAGFGIPLNRSSLHTGDFDDVPVIPNIDAAIIAAMDAARIEAKTWTDADPPRDRDEWAVMVAGRRGAVLAAWYGIRTAATLIYAASRPDKPVPDFDASDADTWADLLKCAGGSA